MAVSMILANLDSVEVYQCAVCMNKMLDLNPRFLTCHHSFCENCLEQLIKNGKIECPTCRSETEVEGNNVTNLPINFILMNIREGLAKHLSKGLVCNLCYENKAVSKCCDCLYNMCEECSNVHTDMKLFKNHKLRSLCEKHSDGIATHICLQCAVPVCTKCIMTDHRSHQDMVKSFEEGIMKLKVDLVSMGDEVNRDISHFCASINNDDKTEIESQINELQKRVMLHKTLATEAENALTIVEEIAGRNDTVQIAFDGILKRLMDLSQEIDKTVAADWKELLPAYSKLVKRKAILKPLKESFSLYHNFAPSPFTVEPIGKPNVVTVKWFDEPVMEDYYFQVHGEKMQNPIAISATDYATSVIVADKGSKVVFQVKLDEGVVQLNDIENGYGELKDVKYLHEQIYILYEGALKIYNVGSSEPVAIYTPFSRMNKMLVISSENIVITRRSGEVCVFNSEENSSKIVVKGLQNPTYITMWSSVLEEKFIITEYGKNKIHIYNNVWDHINTISPLEGGTHSLCGIAATTEGVLVACRHTDTVDLFNLEGQLLSHVLTASHGLHNPVALSLIKPYLWVTEIYPGRVKCYKVTY